jgi:H+/Cl- antiporter ClcA
VSKRRLVPLALLVTALLAVVAIVAHGRPLGSHAGHGSGLPQVFWDYVFTTIVIVFLLMAVTTFVALAYFRRSPDQRQPYANRTLRSIVILIIVAALVFFVARHLHNLQHLLQQQKPKKTPTGPSGGRGKNLKHKHEPALNRVQFQWEELALVIGLLLLLGLLAAATRRRLGPGTERGRRAAPEVLAAALDESLDDLRADPDLRRAIIAAYARMETALAAAGLPRHEAETPFEYLERALLALDASAFAVHRLTDLFEWARFSHHEPEPWMRDEAVDALVAVRDELRASELAPA